MLFVQIDNPVVEVVLHTKKKIFNLPKTREEKKLNSTEKKSIAVS